jgi:hypothetical protein
MIQAGFIALCPPVIHRVGLRLKTAVNNFIEEVAATNGA